MVEFAGWAMPQQYSSVRREQAAVRTAAALFDVSHMGRFELEGAAAGEFLQATVTGDLAQLPVDRARYTLMCRSDGGVIDDLVVHRGPRRWMMVVNAGCRDKDWAWLMGRAPSGVRLHDRGAELCLLALQGPRAAALLSGLGGAGVSRLPRFGCLQARVAGEAVVASRSGYTGEDGFELSIPAARAGPVWDALLEAGTVPCGLACRDVCRLEAGLRLYGSDMDETTSPYEAGLGWAVRLDKGEFVGRSALREIRDRGPARTLIGLAALGRVIPRRGMVVAREGEPIGAVTSGTYSFWLGRGIALAAVLAGRARPKTLVGLGDRAERGQAEAVGLPFYRGCEPGPARIMDSI